MTKPTATEPARLSLLDRIVMPIVVGALAFAGALLAANISTSGATENQRALLDEEKRRLDQEQKSEIYLGFMAAVSDYAIPLSTAIDCFQEKYARPQKCLSALTSEQGPRRDLRNAFNKVIVFGSDPATRAAGKLYDSLIVFDKDHNSSSGTAEPPVVPSREIDIPPSVAAAAPQSASPTVDWAEEAELAQVSYEKSYIEFIRVMCAEMPTIPRADCRR